MEKHCRRTLMRWVSDGLLPGGENRVTAKGRWEAWAIAWNGNTLEEFYANTMVKCAEVEKPLRLLPFGMPSLLPKFRQNVSDLVRIRWNYRSNLRPYPGTYKKLSRAWEITCQELMGGVLRPFVQGPVRRKLSVINAYYERQRKKDQHVEGKSTTRILTDGQESDISLFSEGASRPLGDDDTFSDMDDEDADLPDDGDDEDSPRHPIPCKKAQKFYQCPDAESSEEVGTQDFSANNQSNLTGSMTAKQEVPADGAVNIVASCRSKKRRPTSHVGQTKTKDDGKTFTQPVQKDHLPPYISSETKQFALSQSVIQGNMQPNKVKPQHLPPKQDSEEAKSQQPPKSSVLPSYEESMRRNDIFEELMKASAFFCCPGSQNADHPARSSDTDSEPTTLKRKLRPSPTSSEEEFLKTFREEDEDETHPEDLLTKILLDTSRRLEMWSQNTGKEDEDEVGWFSGTMGDTGTEVDSPGHVVSNGKGDESKRLSKTELWSRSEISSSSDGEDHSPRSIDRHAVRRKLHTMIPQPCTQYACAKRRQSTSVLHGLLSHVSPVADNHTSPLFISGVNSKNSSKGTSPLPPNDVPASLGKSRLTVRKVPESTVEYTRCHVVSRKFSEARVFATKDYCSSLERIETGQIAKSNCQTLLLLQSDHACNFEDDGSSSQTMNDSSSPSILEKSQKLPFFKKLLKKQGNNSPFQNQVNEEQQTGYDEELNSESQQSVFEGKLKPVRARRALFRKACTGDDFGTALHQTQSEQFVSSGSNVRIISRLKKDHMFDRTLSTPVCHNTHSTMYDSNVQLHARSEQQLGQKSRNPFSRFAAWIRKTVDRVFRKKSSRVDPEPQQSYTDL